MSIPTLTISHLEKLWQHCCDDTLIIASNQSLVFYLQQAAFEAVQNDQCPPPLITTASSWFTDLYNKHPKHLHSLLNATQQRVLWSHISQTSLHQHQWLGNLEQSWKNYRLHETNWSSILDKHPNPDWWQWIKAFQNHKASSKTYDLWDAMDWLANQISSIKTCLPKQCFLFTQNALTPCEKKLYHSIANHCKVINIQIQSNQNALSQCFAAQSQEEECQFVMQSSLQSKSKRIACLLLDHNNMAGKLASNALLMPDQSKKIFHFAPYRRLNTFPWVKSLKLVLQSLTKPLLHQNLEAILFYPYWFTIPQAETLKALLWSSIKKEGQWQSDWQHIIKHAKHLAITYPDLPWHKLIEQCQAFDQASKSIQSARPLSKWSDWLIEQLIDWQQFGPNVSASNQHSQEACVIQAMVQKILQIKSLDQMMPAMDFESFIDFSQAVAQNTPFEPPSEHACKVFVMPFTDGLDMIFDKIFIMQANQDNWPVQNKQDNWLPMDWQENHMQNAHYQRYSSLSNINSRLSSMSDEIDYTYSKWEDDQAKEKSTLLDELPEQTISNVKVMDFDPKNLETNENKNIIPQQSKTLTLSTSTLQAQLNCPRQAFLKYRLKLSDEPTIHIGLNMAERGVMIHNLLENLFTMIPDQQTLLGFSDQALSSLCKTTIEQEVKKWQKKKPHTFKEPYIRQIKTSLTNTLNGFLELEKSRPEYKIHALEKSISYPYESNQQTSKTYCTTIKIRIDRIDQLADNSYAIIDYKTGQKKPMTAWLENMQDIQLPTYQLLLAPEADTLAFAYLKPNIMRFDSAGLSCAFEKKTKLFEINDWQEKKKQWKKAFIESIEGYQNGLAIPMPLLGKETCKKCSFVMTCQDSLA
jgi:hypothetical protein